MTISFRRHWPLFVAVDIVIVAVAAYLFWTQSASEPVADTPSEADDAPAYLSDCVQHGAISYHIHPFLTITVDGEPLEVPANIGVDEGCMSPVHTHDATGKIHVEYPTPVDATLADFFRVWGRRMSDFGTLTGMTVNGEASGEAGGLVLRDGDRIALAFETERAAAGDWPVYLTTMTHLEGNWTQAATNEAYFSRIADQLRYGMDLAEEYGATLTIESETPFAEGSARFGDNVLAEALARGHGVGTHCDIDPKVAFTDAEMAEEFARRKVLVDALVGAENNLGCSGGGGLGDWYAGAVGAGFKYLNGTVGFHYLALPLSERPEGWDNRAIVQEYFHDPAPQSESYYYPFLVGALGFEEDADGGLLITDGTIGVVNELDESQPLGLAPADPDCDGRCPLTAEDAAAAEAFIRAFAAENDGSRPAKLTVYVPTSALDPDDDAALRLFFSAMKNLADEGLVEWASQAEAYEGVMEYYGE